MDFLMVQESPCDAGEILALQKMAYRNAARCSAFTGHNVLSVSRVAVSGNRVVGHIALSPVTISDGCLSWYGLGPISVLPELQKQGIGKSLMWEGLARLKSIGAKGCILVGDPGYYERFGFRSPKDLAIEGVPQQFVLALPLDDSSARGNVVFHEAFAATG